MIDLVPYEYNSVRLFTRKGEYAAFDQGITREVQHRYFNTMLRTMRVRTVIDVGAHIGAFTLWAKQTWPDAQIVAMEAERETYGLLCVNTDEQAGVHPVYARAGYCEGVNKILKDAPVAEQYHTVDVPPMRVGMGEVMASQGWNQLDLLKLDCEGCECDVLEHISPVLLGRINVIVGERYHLLANFICGIGQKLAWGRALYMQDSPDPNHGTFLSIKEG